MSFILDALKKSETDRQRQTAPALFEVKVAAPRRRLPVWAIALGVLLGINLLVLAWFVSRPPASSGAPPVATLNGAAAPAESAAAPPGMVTVPATATYIPANAAPNVTVGPGTFDAGVVAPSAAPPLAEEPLLSSAEPSVPPDYDARDYQPAITPAQANATAAARRAGGTPSRDEVLAQGTALPELRLDLHVYDVDPAKRFIFLNMRKLREGESLPEGVRLDSINQNGARLSYRGTQFTLDAN
jgi:general secretion pathway protein B